MKLKSANPHDLSILGEVEISTEEEIKEKVQKAHQANTCWKDLGVEKRVEVLRKLVDELSARKEELALLQTREIGMPIAISFAETEGSINFLNWYLDNAVKYLSPEITYEDEKSIHKVFYEPIGVATAIAPWNFPIPNAILAIIPNLLVGNTVVFKHSEECPLSGKAIEEMMDKLALPEGVFSEIYGDGSVGDLLIHQDIDLIWFTGSTKVGKYLYQVGAEKFIKVLLEMGGSSPGIVFEDVDLDKQLENMYNSRFYNCGQVCDSAKRFIVHEKKLDEFIEKMKDLLKSKKIGNPEENSTDLGPLVVKRQRDLLEEQVADAVAKGACVITGGKSPRELKGFYFEPTILTNVSHDMRVWQEEVFGPVLPVVTFKTEEEAIQLANDTKYGLGSYIFSGDKERVAYIASKIEAGMVNNNGNYCFVPYNPFGGCKQSGMGRANGKYGFHELTQLKVVASDK